MQRFVSHSVQDTEKIAAKLAEKLKGGEVIAFTGPMGMGKTAFTRGLVLCVGKRKEHSVDSESAVKGLKCMEYRSG